MVPVLLCRASISAGFRILHQVFSRIDQVLHTFMCRQVGRTLQGACNAAPEPSAMISRYVERMLPEQYRRADADTLRRARLVLFVQAVFFLYLPFPTLSNAAAKNWAAVGSLLAACPILALMPTMLRRSVVLAGNYTAGMFFLVVGVLGYFLGGPASANWWFLPLTPMLAMLLAGRRSAWRWALVTLAAGGTVTVLTLRGFAWPAALEMPKRQLFWAVTFLGTTVVLYALTSVYEHAKEMMRVGLANANAEMRRVLDNVGQGFMTVDANGQISGERSAILERWFGPIGRTEETFERMAEQGRNLAARLHKAPLELELDHNDVRLDPERFSPLWAAFVHAVRNAIDHGLETPAERQQAGKAEAARITLSSRLDGMAVIIEIADNGRGIDWARVRDRARAAGLLYSSTADLEAALFADGVSTKDDVTEVSGRGVGLAALRQVCQMLGGSIAIHSDLGRGTRLTIRVPISAQLGTTPHAA